MRYNNFSYSIILCFKVVLIDFSNLVLSASYSLVYLFINYSFLFYNYYSNFFSQISYSSSYYSNIFYFNILAFEYYLVLIKCFNLYLSFKTSLEYLILGIWIFTISSSNFILSSSCYSNNYYSINLDSSVNSNIIFSHFSLNSFIYWSFIFFKFSNLLTNRVLILFNDYEIF